MKLDFPIRSLEKEKRKLEKHIKENHLMAVDLAQARKELKKIKQLKDAIKCLRDKQ